MVLSSRILCSSGLAADIQPVDGGDTRGTSGSESAVDSPPHAFYHFWEMDRVDHGVLFLIETVFYFDAFGGFDDMGDIVVAPVCDCRAEVGKVKRSGQNFSLSDREGNNSCRVPVAFSIGPVVCFPGRNASAELGREVASELASKPETQHHVMPVVKGLLYIVIFLVVEDVLQHIAVICVTGHHDRFFHIEGRAVVMASQLPSCSEMVSGAARVHV